MDSKQIREALAPFARVWEWAQANLSPAIMQNADGYGEHLKWSDFRNAAAALAALDAEGPTDGLRKLAQSWRSPGRWISVTQRIEEVCANELEEALEAQVASVAPLEERLRAFADELDAGWIPPGGSKRLHAPTIAEGIRALLSPASEEPK